MLADLIRERPGDFKDATTAFTQWMTAQHHGLATRFLDVSRNPLVALFFACWDDELEHDDGRLIVFQMPNGSNGLVTNYDSYYAALVANYAKLSRKEQKELALFWSVVQATRLHIGHREVPALLHLKDLISQDQPSDRLMFIRDDYLEMKVDFLSRIFVIEPPLSIERVRAQFGAFITSGICMDFGDDSNMPGRDPTGPPVMFRVPKECKKNILKELDMLQVMEKTLFPSLDTSAKAIMQKYQGNQ